MYSPYRPTVTGPYPLTNDDLALAYDMGRDRERAAVVAWLREVELIYEMHGYRFISSVFCHHADMIELGEHRREEEPWPQKK